MLRIKHNWCIFKLENLINPLEVALSSGAIRLRMSFDYAKRGATQKQ